MKVAYIFATGNSQKILDKMIVPQILSDTHGAEVAGMFFFMDNTFLLLAGTEMGEKLNRINYEKGTILMACDQCAMERGIDEKLVSGAAIGCFPNLYTVLASAGVDQIITI